MTTKDYYSLLGVDRQAPDREIKRAYYNLARGLHPDKAKSPDEARANADRLATISRAYNTLKDPKKRAEYDQSIGGGRPAAPVAGKPSPPAPAPAKQPAKQPDPPTTPPAPAAAVDPEATQPGVAPPPIRPVISSRDLANQRVVTAQKAFVKGMEYFKTSDFKKALPFFEVAVENDPEGEAQYHLRLAQCLMKTRGSFTRAVTSAETACRLDTYNVEYKLVLGEIYETVGVASKAQQVYEDVLRWDTDNERAKARLQFMGADQSKTGGSLLAKIFPSIFGKG